MHRFLIIAVLCSLSAAQTELAPPLPSKSTAGNASISATPTPEGENGKRARALLDQTIQALGGQAYLTAQNRVDEGRWYSLYHGGSRGPGALYRQFVHFPDRDRLEILGRGNVFVPLPLFGSVDVIVVGRQKKKQNDLVIIHNGNKGYETTNKGTAPQDKKDLTSYLRRRDHSLDQALRKWTKDPTVECFYDGLAIVDSKPTDQVTLLSNKNDSITVYLDQNSHLPVKTSFTWRDPEDRQKNVEEEIYDNYRLVQGIQTPLSITRTFNGEVTHQRFISTAKYNLPLTDSIFEATVDYDPMAPPKKR